ncbi:tetratricopeptide repeat protein [Seonamhaeicola sp. MEBiC1930]|uniref:tetratricopeptide repeat protein n=1 Tax=Seonamhaeicola sp. MEBiC01930 TaxID=2976768 RepID=UPI003250ACA2
MLRYRLITLLFFGFILTINSQNKMKIDSLLSVYKKQPLDTLKVKTANNIINYYMYRSIDQAKKYAFESLNLSNEIDFDTGKSLALYQLGVVYNNQDKLDSAKYYYNSSLKIANKIDNKIFKSQANRGLAILEFSQGNLLKADSINTIDLENCIKYGDTMGMALAYDFKGTINQNKGYYSIALKNVIKGTQLFETIKDSVRIADSYNHLATIEQNLGNYNKAISYNTKALKIYEDFNDIYYQAQALNDIGTMYINLNKGETAISYFEKSIQKSKEANVKAIEAAALTNIGTSHMQINKLDEAINYLNQSLQVSKSIRAKRRIAIAENKLADVYLLKNNPNMAIKYGKSAKEYAEKNENLSIKRTALKHLSKGYEQINNTSLAYLNFKEFKLISDSLLNKEKINKIEELRIQFDSEKKESQIALQNEEIKTLNVQVKNKELTKTLYGIGMFSFLAIAGLLYFGFKQRIKKNRIAREKQEATYKQEIEFKKKELASQTLHLVQKNTFIQELKENLEKIKKSPELFKIEFRRLVLLLKKESAEDKDWEVFKSYFSEVHNNFDGKIKSLGKGITEKEIRLASFLRMNLTTKEIASMLNVQPDSVFKSKYRLKKKLNLDKETDLNTFLKSL